MVTVLHQAVIHGDVAELQKFIKKGTIDINAQDEKGNTALKLASQGDGIWVGDYGDEKLQMVKLLLNAGADSDIADEYNDTPLGVAYSWSSEKIFEEKCIVLSLC